MTGVSTWSGRPWLDRLAITASLGCLVHCLALPVVVALLPAWSRWLDVPESFHLWFLLAAAPFSSIVLWPGRKAVAASARPLLRGIGGLALMAIGVAMLGNAVEPYLTAAGAVLLASAHVLNLRRRGHRHR